MVKEDFRITGGSSTDFIWMMHVHSICWTKLSFVAHFQNFYASNTNKSMLWLMVVISQRWHIVIESLCKSISAHLAVLRNV